MKKVIFILAMLFCPSVFAATLTTNTVPYVCQGGATPQLCNSNLTTNSSGAVIHSQVFTSSGTFTPTFTGTVFVSMIGGGASGAGGGGCGGGAGGFYINTPYAVTSGVGVTVTVGAGGVGKGSSPYAAAGTDSFFGTLDAPGAPIIASAQGCSGTPNYGVGGGGYNSLIVSSGYSPDYIGSAFQGGNGAPHSNGTYNQSAGGGSPFGTGCPSSSGSGTPASAAANTGGGGCGSWNSGSAGGNGGSGIVYVQW